MAGDMNCVLDEVLDRQSSSLKQQSSAGSCLNTISRSLNMVDIWRLFNPTCREYSYFSPVHKSYSRIDYFLLDSKLISSVTDVAYHPILISDHAPVSLCLQVANATRGRPGWRLYASMFQDRAFCELIKEKIIFFINSNDKGDVNDLILWESFKAVIRGHIISYVVWDYKFIK